MNKQLHRNNRMVVTRGQGVIKRARVCVWDNEVLGIDSGDGYTAF